MELNDEAHAPFVDDDDVDGLDLTPRTAPPTRGGDDGSWTRKVVVGGVVAVIAAVLLVVAWKGLTDASLYFRTVDEAVAQRDDLGDKRFRIEGTVVPGSIETEAGAVTFVISSDGESAEIRHVGEPPELFQPGIPVVLEGRWSQTDEWFDSDRMLVKHSETYSEENPDRVENYGDPDAPDEQSFDDLMDLHTESVDNE